MERWRLIVDDGASAAFGLAADEWLMGHHRGDDGFDATLRLYTYASHCALVGRFQDVATEVRLDECERAGVAVNRRPTGGGAILMGRDQLGVALTFAADRPGLPGLPAHLYTHLSAGVMDALEAVGLQPRFRPKNDLEVEGRKIAGLGVCRDATGGMLFHTSLLVDLDVPLMLRLLSIPAEKISDKVLRFVADRTTTVRRATGRDVTIDEMRDAVAAGYARRFGAELVAAPLVEAELAAIDDLIRTKYGTSEWIDQRRLDAADGDPRAQSRAALQGACFGPAGAGVGHAVSKTPGGLLRVYAALSGETIKSVLVTGDFFADPAIVTGLESRLKWAPAEAATIEAAVQAEVGAFGVAHLESAALAAVIIKAVDNAKRARSTG
ncbi:MAG: biotin/lipoate protein ligase [Chloroflexi bacterium]|nr:biotin/lipoate protein ligase [Chloroflexota bacterium]